MGDEGSDSPRGQHPHQRRGGPTAGHSEPCLAPRGADLPKHTFSRGFRPWLWLCSCPRKEGQEGAELGLVPGLLQEPGQAPPQPLPRGTWVPTAKGLVSTLSPCPLWLSASHHLPSLLHCSLPEASHRNAAGAAGTTHHQHCSQRVLAHAMCHHGTGRKGSWGCWRPQSPELWGHSCCQGQQSICNIPHGTGHCHSKPPGSPQAQAAQAVHPWHTEP